MPLLHHIEIVIAFVKDRAGLRSVNPSDELIKDLGIDGDDFYELMEAFMNEFYVDMNGYEADYHQNPEAHGYLGRPVKIPITVQMLFEFANKGKWDVKYPSE